MNINNLNKEQIVFFLRNQWKPVGLAGLILVALVITLLIPARGKNSGKTNPGGIATTNENANNNSAPEKKSSNIFSFLFNSKKDESSQQNNRQGAVVSTPQDLINSQTTESTVTKVNPNGSKTTQKLTISTTINTTQGTINPSSNIDVDLSSNEEADDLRIVFQNPDGTTFTYIPPGTPPDEVRWARYTNNNDKYAINYPFNWQFVYSVANGHEGVALYPPNVNPNDPKSPFLGFGMADKFLLPAAGDNPNALITPIIADGQSGNLYTKGSLGNSYIAAVLSYRDDYFGLNASKSDATFAYVYYYMINSLTFNIE
jgi:hypothetical protein